MTPPAAAVADRRTAESPIDQPPRPRGRAGANARPRRVVPAPRPRRVSGPARPAQRAQPTRGGRAAAPPRSRAAAQRAPAPARRRGLAQRALQLYARVADSPLLDRLVRGRLWIGLLAFALIGIVAMQLIVLKLNAGIGATLTREGELQRANAQLGIETATAGGEGRVEPLAAAQGMTFAAPGSVHFVTASPAYVGQAAAVLAQPIRPREAASPPEGQSSAGQAAANESAAGGEGTSGAESRSGESTSNAESASSAGSTSNAESTTSAGSTSGAESTSSAGLASSTGSTSGTESTTSESTVGAASAERTEAGHG